MKVSILTLHNVCNYGSQLQAYATQEKMKQYFEDVSFLDFRREDTYGIKLLETFTKGNLLKIPLILPTLIYWKFLFGGFQKKYLKMSKQKYLCDQDFDKFDDYADLYFTGSDQVWNSGWNRGVIPQYYLNFVPKEKPKYTYASSFGKEILSSDEIDTTKEFIYEYEMISVREESAKNILTNQYGYKNVIRVLDPTLAMPKEFWRSVAPPSKIKTGYILLYNLNRSKKFDNYAKELSRKTGLKLYRFCTRLDQIVRPGKSLIMPDIFALITMIDHAKYVLTDSFHATAFAINLETEPICIYPPHYESRLSDFLKLIDCEQRHVQNFGDFDVINRTVDFQKVNCILKEEREKIDNFFLSILSENKETSNEKNTSNFNNSPNL